MNCVTKKEQLLVKRTSMLSLCVHCVHSGAVASETNLYAFLMCALCSLRSSGQWNVTLCFLNEYIVFTQEQWLVKQTSTLILMKQCIDKIILLFWVAYLVSKCSTCSQRITIFWIFKYDFLYCTILSSDMYIVEDIRHWTGTIA